MPTLDQRILIPAAPDEVWKLVSDIAQSPTWQTDCQTISVLTTKREGPNVRWRYTSKSGRECVIETTAWYDNLGYEYTYVDGAPFRQSRGRIRLQEIAEGTIVQWTFSYEMGGVVGALRDAISTRRNLENVMVSSLKMLWRKMNQGGYSTRESKSLIQEAPDVNARAQYKPRHPSIMDETGAKVAVTAGLAEPPISEDDTKPRPAVASAATLASNESTVEELSRFQRPSEPTEQQPGLVASEIAGDTSVQQEEPSFLTSSESPEGKSGEPIALPTPRSATLAEPTKKAETAPSTAMRLPTLPGQEGEEMDTSRLSIWDVFGVPRPSEARQLQALQETDASEASGGGTRQRAGLRSTMRRRLVKVRKP